ncbi:MAG: hypothetical protein M3Y87_03040 [Myxococcota bacterium]|nr:hypothetical protein [Myxococcota bacterium]
MTRALRRCAVASLAITLSLGTGCTNEIWLSDALDASTADASPDAPRELDGGQADASDAVVDSGHEPLPRACETGPVTILQTSVNPPLEQPTLAVSGRLESLRYGLLVPPSASTTATEETRLIVSDRGGTALHERAMRLGDAAGSPASTATLHSLSPEASEDGFLLLAPRGIWLLDADGAGEQTAAFPAAGPSPAWQRVAGWLDADRFAFVSETADLRLAVFDRRTGAVETTSISAADAASVHVEPGGITISSVGPLSETVVYDPDLSGAETLRTDWDDGALLAARLIGVGASGGERIWLVRDANEFRTFVTSYRVSPDGPPVAGAALMLVGPLTATREDGQIAIESSATPGRALTVYSLESDTFSTLSTVFGGSVVVEHEREGALLSFLSLEPAGKDRLSLELTCGVR